ncbi:hypothetical protein DTL42_23285 [Bremerella cremea]|uniref:Uncharacterized protein n=1 Tax=Bremerella cremea TaxID=1031537 RepID=A0A368KL56_9BACT|nr:hypothetical protein DTL42_23285 [Bremerella cremea]
MDDRSGKEQTSVDTSHGGYQSTRTYSKSAVDERRIRIVDVVPVYGVHVSLVYVAIVVMIAGLLALDHYFSRVIRWTDLNRVDSLGTYLASGSLFVAALLAVLIYRIRRHRLDDYRGYYRCWLWFAGLLLLASLDTMLNFRQDVAMGLETASKLRFFGQTDGWWAVVWCVGFGSMILRAAIEVRESYGTLAVATLSSGLLLLGVTLQLDLVMLPSTLPAEITLHAAQLLGVGLLLASLVQYARYVWLDAQGLISRRERVVTEQDTDHEEAAAAKPKPKRSRAASKKQAAEPEEDEQDLAETKPRRGWFSFGRKKVEQDAEEETSQPVAAKKRSTSKPADDEASEEQPKRGWFSFGRKAKPEQEGESVEPKPVATKKRSASKPAEDEAGEQQPKRGWFSFGRKAKSEADGENEEPKPAAAKKRAASKPAEEEPAEVKAKRSWLSWGRKEASEDPADGAKVAASSGGAKSDENAEPAPKKGWFSWGSKSETEDETAATSQEAEEERTIMTPRIKTRPKPAPAPEPAPEPAPAPRREVPTITGNAAKAAPPQDESDSGEEDEEILRLEGKPDHLLSKAERRRLKKLKRRAAA